jgi:hypothetical protein
MRVIGSQRSFHTNDNITGTYDHSVTVSPELGGPIFEERADHVVARIRRLAESGA